MPDCLLKSVARERSMPECKRVRMRTRSVPRSKGHPREVMGKMSEKRASPVGDSSADLLFQAVGIIGVLAAFSLFGWRCASCNPSMRTCQSPTSKHELVERAVVFQGAPWWHSECLGGGLLAALWQLFPVRAQNFL